MRKYILSICMILVSFFAVNNNCYSAEAAPKGFELTDEEKKSPALAIVKLESWSSGLKAQFEKQKEELTKARDVLGNVNKRDSFVQKRMGDKLQAEDEENKRKKGSLTEKINGISVSLETLDAQIKGIDKLKESLGLKSDSTTGAAAPTPPSTGWFATLRSWIPSGWSSADLSSFWLKYESIQSQLNLLSAQLTAKVQRSPSKISNGK